MRNYLLIYYISIRNFQRYFSAAWTHFGLLAGFVIAIIVEFIQQFFLVVKRPFDAFCQFSGPLFVESVFCLLWPSFSRWKRARSLFLLWRHPALIMACESRVNSVWSWCLWLLASIINSCDRTCQLLIK